MKKKYTSPLVEILEFQLKESIMDVNIGGGGVDVIESIPTGEEWDDPWA